MDWKELFKLKTEDLFKVLTEELVKHGYKPIDGENYLYAVGSIPIMLCAHVDTVHTSSPEVIVYDKESGIAWSPQGLGADDRAGVLGILELIHKGFKPFVLFTNFEERGCLGAKKAAKELNPNVKYVIELDRKGNNDCVFYQCDNKSFIKYIQKFGFEIDTGSMSDITYLCPTWGVAGVNLSIGYFNQHTTSEYLVFPYLYSTLSKVEAMLRAVPSKPFKYVAKTYPTPKVIPVQSYAQSWDSSYWGNYYSSYPKTAKPIATKTSKLVSLYFSGLKSEEVFKMCQTFELPVTEDLVQTILFNYADDIKEEVKELALDLALRYIEDELSLMGVDKDEIAKYDKPIKSIE